MCCPPLVGSALSEPEAERLAQALRVIADPARLRLVSLVAASEGGESCVCDLTDRLDQMAQGDPSPTVSYLAAVYLKQARALQAEPAQ